jgi:hypothetical protein
VSAAEAPCPHEPPVTGPADADHLTETACGSSGPGPAGDARLRCHVRGGCHREQRCPPGGRRAMDGRTPVQDRRSSQTAAWPLTAAWPPVPDTSCPDDGRSGSSGRSIR